MSSAKDINQSNISSIQNEYAKRSRIRKAKRKSNFSIINTDCLQDPRLSMNCLAVVAYLMSLPEDWEISVSHLAKRFDCSKDKVYSTINELIKLGYMVRYQERNENGAFGEWITEATDDPILLKDAQPLAVSELSPHKEKPEPAFTGSGKKRHNKELISNKVLKNNKQSPTSIQPIPKPQKLSQQAEPSVVVALVEKLKKIGVAEKQAIHWIRQHGSDYVTEKLELALNQAIENPAGFLNKAIANDWKQHLPNEPKTAPNVAVEVLYPTHEENLVWYAALPVEGKQRCYELALNKHAYFGKTLESEGLDYLDTAFLRTTWFKQMMELIGRAKG